MHIFALQTKCVLVGIKLSEKSREKTPLPRLHALLYILLRISQQRR
jgi:hypothetical protein